MRESDPTINVWDLISKLRRERVSLSYALYSAIPSPQTLKRFAVRCAWRAYSQIMGGRFDISIANDGYVERRIFSFEKIMFNCLKVAEALIEEEDDEIARKWFRMGNYYASIVAYSERNQNELAREDQFIAKAVAECFGGVRGVFPIRAQEAAKYAREVAGRREDFFRRDAEEESAEMYARHWEQHPKHWLLEMSWQRRCLADLLEEEADQRYRLTSLLKRISAPVNAITLWQEQGDSVLCEG